MLFCDRGRWSFFKLSVTRFYLSTSCLVFVYNLSTLNKQVSKARWDNSVRQCKTVSHLINYVTSYATSYATAGSYLTNYATSYATAGSYLAASAASV